jgi:hypothetical protein
MQSTLFGVVNFETLRLNILKLVVSSNFEILVAQCCTLYAPDGRGDGLDTVVHQNVRLSTYILTQITYQ